MKIPLIRRGRLVGFVTPSFYKQESASESRIWEDLDLPSLEA